VVNDQPPIDGYHHADPRRTRSAMQSMIPVATGLAVGVARLLPQLADCIEAKSIRVPITNVSAIDLVAMLTRATSVVEINTRLRRVVDTCFPSQLAYTEDAHASVDFNHSPYSAIIDASQTRMSGPRLANLLIWFDNEWGFANRMLELTTFWGSRAIRRTS
jgi:glyceraldehyde 3-phosphate dehydrogenase/D-erythrose 4-phosphate dehydrogenase